MDTPEAYIESFPTPFLTKIEGKPTYDTLKVVVDQISSNAASVQTELGGVQHRYLATTVSPTVFATLPATLFNAPTLSAPVVTTDMTGPQISAANCTYDAVRKQFKQYNALAERTQEAAHCCCQRN